MFRPSEFELYRQRWPHEYGHWKPLERRIVFEVDGLTKVYGMGQIQVHALHGVDLALYQVVENMEKSEPTELHW